MLQYITHILLDAARMGRQMEEAKQRNTAHESLYKNTPSEGLTGVAPFVFRFQGYTPFANWFMERGWGGAWGLMIKSSWPLAELHKHLRKFLQIKTESGRTYYFRFYDPRVLRIFLPTCDTAQLREFFGPIDYFIMEDEDPAFALRFWHENAILKTQRIPRTELFQSTPATIADAVPIPLIFPEDAPKPAVKPETAPAAAAAPATPKPIQPVKPEAVPKPLATPDKPAPSQPAAKEEELEKPQKGKWNMFD